MGCGHPRSMRRILTPHFGPPYQHYATQYQHLWRRNYTFLYGHMNHEVQRLEYHVLQNRKRTDAPLHSTLRSVKRNNCKELSLSTTMADGDDIPPALPAALVETASSNSTAAVNRSEISCYFSQRAIELNKLTDACPKSTVCIVVP